MTPATLGSTAAPTRRRRPRGGACEEPPRLFGAEPVAAIAESPSVAAPAATLADRVADTWAGLVAAVGPVPCLVCGAELQPRWSAGSGVVGGRCGGCGTTLE